MPHKLLPTPFTKPDSIRAAEMLLAALGLKDPIESLSLPEIPTTIITDEFLRHAQLPRKGKLPPAACSLQLFNVACSDLVLKQLLPLRSQSMRKTTIGVLYDRDNTPIAVFPILPKGSEKPRYFSLIDYTIPATSMKDIDSIQLTEALKLTVKKRDDYFPFLSAMDCTYDEKQFLWIKQPNCQPTAYTAEELLYHLRDRTIPQTRDETVSPQLLFLGPTVYDPTPFATTCDASMIQHLKKMCEEDALISNGEVHETALGSGYLLLSAATTWLPDKQCSFSGSDTNPIATAFANYNFNQIYNIPAQFFTTNTLELGSVTQPLSNCVLLFGNSPASELDPRAEKRPAYRSYADCYDYGIAGHTYWTNLATFFSQTDPHKHTFRTCFWNSCTTNFLPRFQSLILQGGRYGEDWLINEIATGATASHTPHTEAVKLFEAVPREN